MARVLITPVKSSGVAPYEVSGKLTSKVFNGEKIYYIGSQSYPAEIVIIICPRCENSEHKLEAKFCKICGLKINGK